MVFVALCIWQIAREHKNWAGWALLVLFAPTLLASLEIWSEFELSDARPQQNNPEPHRPRWRIAGGAEICSARFDSQIEIGHQLSLVLMDFLKLLRQLVIPFANLRDATFV
jgi:hypothetical protein